MLTCKSMSLNDFFDISIAGCTPPQTSSHATLTSCRQIVHILQWTTMAMAKWYMLYIGKTAALSDVNDDDPDDNSCVEAHEMIFFFIVPSKFTDRT